MGEALLSSRRGNAIHVEHSGDGVAWRGEAGPVYSLHLWD